ncbi:aminoglycoside phosphotransferase family protein [Streptomyces sp. NPDC088354]|uniref:aminoglycoside phosphotransferase family protein n=1 Tax=unclassified Streptomyces TaxID=2593676 RepID=UPI0029B7B7B0|nr:aminoglycoside phosphotransferase family protein [Streptomyces sp. MI02-7b]MDX3077949.1 aminoglycoside phosphotransferase family protein [Streptomyces sp. MI02-7b]
MTPAPQHLQPPERLIRTVSAWEGDPGRAWLAGLPERAADHLARWDLRPERVLSPGGQISMVVLVRQADDTPATLKLGLVTDETRHEHAALARWDGRGAVRLLRADPDEGVLLMERLHGDVSLRSLPEAKAMLEASATLQRLWVPPGDAHPFTSVADRTAGLAARLRERGRRPYVDVEAHPLIDEALAIRDALTGASEPEAMLLHGDYHHGNVLSADRVPWLAIDPKPLVGDPAFDLAWLVRDRLDTLLASPGAQAAARRRVAKLSDALEVDRDRVRGWALFRAVEAGVWAFSVGDRPSGELLLEFAGLL